MASTKPSQDLPVDPSDYNLAYHVFTRGTTAALEAEDYRKLQHALELIVELRRRHPNAGGLVKFHAGISNMCASMATDPQDIELHRQTAISCARDFVRCDPTSKECAFYLAYFHKNFSYDSRGLNQAIEECNRGILLPDSDLDSRNWTQQNWTQQLHGLRAQCEAKLEILKQDKHRESQLGQRNLQKRKWEQPVNKMANSVDATISSKNTQPQEISDLDAEKIRRLVSSLPTGPGLKVIETARASSQEEQLRSQAIDVHKKLDSNSEKIRRLVSSLPRVPGSEVIETARASSQEEQSRPEAIDVRKKLDSDAEKIRRLVSSLPRVPGSEVAETARASSQEEQSRQQEIDVHVMSREVPVLFFEHVRLDMAFINTIMSLLPDIGSEKLRKVLVANLKYFLAASNLKDIPSDDGSSS